MRPGGWRRRPGKTAQLADLGSIFFSTSVTRLFLLYYIFAMQAWAVSLISFLKPKIGYILFLKGFVGKEVMFYGYIFEIYIKLKIKKDLMLIIFSENSNSCLYS